MSEPFPCALCAAQTTGSPEHVVLAAFGGRKTTTDFICEPCNNRLGGEIDKPFAEEFAPLVRVGGATRSGRRAELAPVGGLSTLDGAKVSVLPGPVFHARPAQEKVVTHLDDGGLHLALEVNDPERFASLIIGHIVDGSLADRDVRTQTVEMQTVRVAPIRWDYKFNILVHARSVAKSCLAALVPVVGRDVVASARFARVRAFIARGEGDGLQPWLYTLDGAARAALRQHYGLKLLHHALIVFNSPLTVEGILLLFGALPYRIRLAEGQLEGLQEAVIHEIDPVGNTHVVRRGQPPSSWTTFSYEDRWSRAAKMVNREAVDEATAAAPPAESRPVVEKTAFFRAALASVRQRMSAGDGLLNPRRALILETAERILRPMIGDGS